MVACSAIGAIALARRRSAAPWFLLIPVGLAAVASLVRQWPLTPRLLLFAVPAVLILLPAGLEAIGRAVPARYRGPVLAVPSLVLVGLAATGLGRKWGADALFADVPQALRKLSERTGPPATIYFSVELEAPCIYYLRYHPDATLRNDSSTPGCVIDGANMLIGSWPEYVGVPYGSATERERVVAPEWLEMEGQWLLDQPPRDLVVLIGYMPDLRKKLPAWLERAGAKRVAEQRMQGLLMVTYRLPAVTAAR
jgi:hypothetical protein